MNILSITAQKTQDDPVILWSFGQGANSFSRCWFFQEDKENINLLRHALSIIIANKKNDFYFVEMNISDDAGNTWVLQRDKNNFSFTMNDSDPKPIINTNQIIQEIWHRGSDLSPFDSMIDPVKHYEIRKDISLQAKEIENKKGSKNKTKECLEGVIKKTKNQIGQSLGYKKLDDFILNDIDLESLSEHLLELEYCKKQLSTLEDEKIRISHLDDNVEELISELSILDIIQQNLNLALIFSNFKKSKSRVIQINQKIVALEKKTKHKTVENIFTNTEWLHNLASDCQVEIIREWRKTVEMINTTELPRVSGVINAYSKPFETLLREDGDTVKNLITLIQENQNQNDHQEQKNSFQKAIDWFSKKLRLRNKDYYKHKELQKAKNKKKKIELFSNLNKVLTELGLLRRTFVGKKKYLEQTIDKTNQFFQNKSVQLKSIEKKWQEIEYPGIKLKNRSEITKHLDLIKDNIEIYIGKKDLEATLISSKIYDKILMNLGATIELWESRRRGTCQKELNNPNEIIQKAKSLCHSKAEKESRLKDLQKQLHTTINTPEKDFRYLTRRQESLIQKIHDLIKSEVHTITFPLKPDNLSVLSRRIGTIKTLKNIITSDDYHAIQAFNDPDPSPITTWSVGHLETKKDKVDLLRLFREMGSNILNILLIQDSEVKNLVAQYRIGEIKLLKKDSLPPNKSSLTHAKRISKQKENRFSTFSEKPTKHNRTNLKKMPTLVSKQENASSIHHVITEKKTKISVKKAQEVVDLLNGIMLPKQTKRSNKSKNP